MYFAISMSLSVSPCAMSTEGAEGSVSKLLVKIFISLCMIFKYQV